MCDRCKTWKRVLTRVLGETMTEVLERMVVKEMSSKKKETKKNPPS